VASSPPDGIHQASRFYINRLREISAARSGQLESTRGWHVCKYHSIVLTTTQILTVDSCGSKSTGRSILMQEPRTSGPSRRSFSLPRSIKVSLFPQAAGFPRKILPKIRILCQYRCSSVQHLPLHHQRRWLRLLRGSVRLFESPSRSSNPSYTWCVNGRYV
jgi:hypothetical protein